jgi:SAM-dependent methyltransferase
MAGSGTCARTVIRLLQQSGRPINGGRCRRSGRGRLGQFHLLCEDLDRWFDETLQISSQSTDPSRVAWSMLDLGCGEGQFRRVARRWPGATMVGVYIDRAVVEAASRDDTANVRFLVHDAHEPLPPVLDRGAAFDIAAMWMVLLYRPDKKGALAKLAEALAPDGVLLLCNQPGQAARFSHLVATELIAASLEMGRRFGILGPAASLDLHPKGNRLRDLAPAIRDSSAHAFHVRSRSLAGQPWPFRPLPPGALSVGDRTGAVARCQRNRQRAAGEQPCRGRQPRRCSGCAR